MLSSFVMLAPNVLAVKRILKHRVGLEDIEGVELGTADAEGIKLSVGVKDGMFDSVGIVEDEGLDVIYAIDGAGDVVGTEVGMD